MFHSNVTFGPSPEATPNRTRWIVAFCAMCGEPAHVTELNTWCMRCRISLRRMQQD